MLMTVRILGLGPALSIIGEWRPADFSHLGGLEIVLLARPRRRRCGAGVTLPPVRIVILLGLVHMALSADAQRRNLRPRRAARHRPATGQPDRLPSAPRRTQGAATAYARQAIAGAPGRPRARDLRPLGGPPLRAEPEDHPGRRGRGAEEGRSRPVLNQYDFGGYLVYAGIPTFIDGRTELYGGAFFARYYSAVTLADLAGLDRLLDKYTIDATLLAPGTPANAYLDRLPGWHRLYADDIAVVHVRD